MIAKGRGKSKCSFWELKPSVKGTKKPRVATLGLFQRPLQGKNYLPNLLDVKPEPDQHEADSYEADAQADAAMIALNHCVLAGL